MVKITQEELKDLAVVYNNQDKKAMYQMLRRDYGIKNPTCVFHRMVEWKSLGYNPQTDRFEALTCESNEKLFLSIDDLCSPAETEVVKSASDDSASTEMSSLIQELIEEKLLELNRYIKISSLSKVVTINQTALESDGYHVIMN